MVWIIFGEPKPFSAQSVARIRIRSINGFVRKVSGSTSGKYGLVKPIGVTPLLAGFLLVATLGIGPVGKQSPADEDARGCCRRKTTVDPAICPPSWGGEVYRQERGESADRHRR